MKRMAMENGVEADVCETMFERMRGLIGRPAPAKGRGMLIPKCNAIHTLFMRYPIDAVFFDCDGKPVRTVRGIKPWRLFVWGGWRARSVLETVSMPRGSAPNPEAPADYPASGAPMSAYAWRLMTPFLFLNFLQPPRSGGKTSWQGLISFCYSFRSKEAIPQLRF